MQRMTNVLSRMLNDPATRAALSGGGEDYIGDSIEQPLENSQQRLSISMDNETSNDSYILQNDSLNNSTADERDNSNEDIIHEQFSLNEYVHDVDTSHDITNNHLENESSSMDVDLNEIENSSTAGESFGNHNLSTVQESSGEPTQRDFNSNRNFKVMENLHDTLTTMRDGFLERYIQLFHVHCSFLLEKNGSTWHLGKTSKRKKFGCFQEHKNFGFLKA